MLDIKRAIGTGMAMFLVSLVLNAIVTRPLRIDLKIAHPAEFPMIVWIYAIVSIIILSVLGALWYFSSLKVKAGLGSGMLLGATIALLGLVLNIVAFLPQDNGLALIFEYYSHIWYWLPFMLIILVSTMVGILKGSK
jgi:hypothetical protein